MYIIDIIYTEEKQHNQILEKMRFCHVFKIIWLIMPAREGKQVI